MLVPLAPRSSAARETYFRLREAILSGAMPPGSRVYERRVADQLGVSRTPVREALKVLEAEELVVSLGGGGAQVREVTAAEVRDTYTVRALLEAHAARLASERISAQQIRELQRLNGRMRQIVDRAGMDEAQQVSRLAELNADFHKLVVAAAGNRILPRVLQTLIDTPLYARAYFWFTPERRIASIDDHDRLTELLAARDADAAERLWSEHLLHGRDWILEGLEAEAGDDDRAASAVDSGQRPA